MLLPQADNDPALQYNINTQVLLWWTLWGRGEKFTLNLIHNQMGICVPIEFGGAVQNSFEEK